MKKNTILLLCLFMLGLTLTACTADPNNPANQQKTRIEVQPKQKKEGTPEEKQKLQDQLKDAADKDDGEAFATALVEVYKNGWEKDEDFQSIESKFYVKATGYFDKGETDRALKLANTIFAKVPTGWRFKYLKVRCLERLGVTAFEKGDLAKAEEYATQIMMIEFRPEGVNLMAKILIRKAEDSTKKGDRETAKKYLLQAREMQISPELMKEVDAKLSEL
jgi:tetratricopeptide (TPR) repeat protein